MIRIITATTIPIAIITVLLLKILFGAVAAVSPLAPPDSRAEHSTS